MRTTNVIRTSIGCVSYGPPGRRADTRVAQLTGFSWEVLKARNLTSVERNDDTDHG